MKISKGTPAFLRYFNARFKPFTSPLFWGSLGTLAVGGLAIYQYWQHPDWLQTNSENLTNSATLGKEKVPDVSSEDLAAAADLDNIDVLLKELEQNQTLSEIAAEGKQNQTSQLKREESKFSRFQKAQKDRLSNSTQLDSYSSGIDSGNQKIMELLKPPSFSSYQSNRNNQNQSLQKVNKPQVDIIPNPVGNIYLSNRNQTPQNANATVTPAAAPAGTPAGTPAAPVTPNAEVANPEIGNNVNNVNGNNLAGGVVPNPNGQNSQINSGVQPINGSNGNISNPNRFAPASSIIQSQQTLPLTNSTIPSSTTGFDSLNPSPGANNSATTSMGSNSNTVNRLNSNSVNGISNVNNNNPNLTSTTPQPVQNSPLIPGQTTRLNDIRREGLSTIRDGDNPNLLQNNYRNSQLRTPNYNRSVPNGYQLQPQTYQQNNLNGSAINNGGVNRNSNNFGQPTTNAPAIRNLENPSLQPSGVFSTSEIDR